MKGKTILGIIVLAICISAAVENAYGQNIFKDVFSSKEKMPKTSETENIFDLDLEKNLSAPKINNHQKPIIQAFQKAQAQKLAQQDIAVELMRQGEVIVATIASDNLFAPNSTNLKPSGESYLLPFIPFFGIPGMYKIILVMHSDDTGSQEYTLSLTERRVNTIYDWFEQRNLEISTLVPYAMGDSEPLESNNSRKNRYANRRLEIYLVPGNTMISYAKAGRLR